MLSRRIRGRYNLLKVNQKKLKPLLKYYMKNGIAYTEDHIPVQKLHLFGISMELTEEALLNYFTWHYGQVLGMERIEATVPADEKQEYLPTWNAFALFADACVAAKVLQIPQHWIGLYKFYVQASYSWLQPVTVEETNESEFAIFPDILKLNDDCLECVFQYLSLADQIRLARTCTRFRFIYQRVSARQHKSVDAKITKDLTLWETRDFCQLTGHHVETLSCFRDGNDYFMRCFYAALHFPNLKELEVHDKDLKVHKIQRILLGMNNLKELTLRTKPRSIQLDLVQLKELKRLWLTQWNTNSLSLPTSLESLTFQNWRKFNCLPNILQDQSQIKKLQILDSLNIFSIMAFASLEVLEMSCEDDGKALIAQLPKLKKLCLKHYYFCHFCVIQKIIDHCTQLLDHFEIFTKYGTKIPKTLVLLMPNIIGLHTLVLDYLSVIDDEIILALGKLTELKRFGLYESDITDSLVLKLMINCPKLSKLRMEECRNISDNLGHSIISLLRKDIQSGKNQRELPFKLYLRSSLQTDPDVNEVFCIYHYKDSKMGEWFEEELKVKN